MGSDNAIELRRGIEAARDELIVLHRHYRDSLGLEPSANLVAMWLDDLLKNPQLAPLPWLRAEEVTESGSYWWRNDTSYATPVTVYVMKSGTDESCFASAGQLGWWKAMQLKDLGGLWQRIPEPELPEEES